MIKDYVITTLPMKPLNKMKVGSLTSPLYVNFIGDKLKIKKVLSLNELNSFKLIDCSNEYIQILKDVNLKYDEIFIDAKNKSKLLNVVKLLDEKGLLIEKDEEILSCECKKVDMLFSSINSFDNGLLKKENDKYICRECNSLCKISKQKRLFLKIDSKFLNDAKIIPNIYDNNCNQITDNLKNELYLISKARNTGIKYNKYNLDIDFLWSLYLVLFKENNIIVVASNRHIIKVFFTNYIASIFNKKVIYLLHPYIEKKELINWNEELFKYDYYYQHLYLLYSCRWTSKDCFYDRGMLNGLAKIKKTGREKIYKNLSKTDYNNNVDLYDYLNEFITKKINFQKNLKEINRERLLISDYDNTLHIYYDSLIEQGYNFKFNYQYYSDFNVSKRIDKLRINNIFCINTGRSYKSFKNVCNYNYDYLICNNGCEIYDSEDNLLYFKPMEKDDIEIINNYDFKSAIVRKYYPYNNEISSNLTSVSITSDDEVLFNDIISYFKKMLKGVKVYYRYPKIRLVNDLTNKMKASNILIKMLNLDESNVYALGDDDNDYELLINYNSGTFKWASKKIIDAKIKIYDSSIEFMNDMEMKKNEK